MTDPGERPAKRSPERSAGFVVRSLAAAAAAIVAADFAAQRLPFEAALVLGVAACIAAGAAVLQVVLAFCLAAQPDEPDPDPIEFARRRERLAARLRGRAGSDALRGSGRLTRRRPGG